MENIENWVISVHKIVSKYAESILTYLEIHGKNLCVHGEDAKRLLAYSPNTPRDKNECISQLIISQIKKFVRFFFLSTPSHATAPKAD